ncbi:hypothetical protein MASR1M31_16360 [Porphyromonadaceae bacterium]
MAIVVLPYGLLSLPNKKQSDQKFAQHTGFFIDWGYNSLLCHSNQRLYTWSWDVLRATDNSSPTSWHVDISI